MEQSASKANQELESQLKQLDAQNQQAQVQISQLEKSLAEKDKKLKTQEEKIGDLQEENLNQLQQSQAEATAAKQGFDHHITELKKRADELQETATTYKTQLSN